MGVRCLEVRQDDNDEILSYADAVGIIRVNNETRRRARRTTHRAYTIPLPKKECEPYATVEMEQRGDFGDNKDPYQNVLSALNLD